MNVYVVTANGWREGYGVNIYLMGVFTSRKEAQEATHDLPYSTQINEVPIDKLFPLKRDYDNHLEIFDNYSNQYYLGGYVE